MKRQFDKITKPELLAPAGDLSRAKTAIDYGADAIYLGGKSFSLRSRASNFTMEDIREICAYAKEHGANVHVTVNIIPHDEDFEGLKQYLMDLEDAGVTAIIVASPSIMKLAKTYAGKLEVHCSTQMSVTNSLAANYLIDSLHLDRVVLARECSMSEINEITRNVSKDTEAFIHGGMCVNYSGRCTLSNRMTLRDANRGGCAQSCRWQYHLYQQDEELSVNGQMFTMGSRDLMTAEYIRDLMFAGVSSLKIEGRMKTEYYVASIVSGYRHLIDELYENNGKLSDERMAYHVQEIMKGENREVCSGFLPGRAGHDSVLYYNNDNSHVKHDFYGKIVSYDPSVQTAKLVLRNPIDVGDIIEVIAPGVENQTFQVEWMKNQKGEMLERARQPMTTIEMPVPFPVPVDAILRKGSL